MRKLPIANTYQHHLYRGMGNNLTMPPNAHQMTFTAKIASAGLWNLLGNSVSKGLPFLAFFVSANFLTHEDIGKLGLLQATIIVFSVVGGVAMNTVAGVYAAKSIESHVDSAAIWNTCRAFTRKMFTLALTAYLIVGFLYVYMTTHDHFSAPVFLVGGFWLFGSVFQALALGMWNGQQKFRRVAVHNIITGVSSSMGCVVGAYLGGFIGAVAGLTMPTALMAYISFRSINTKYQHTHNATVNAKSVGIPTMYWNISISGLIVWPINWVIQVWISSNTPNGMIEMGDFSIGNQMRNAAILLSTAVTGGILPIMAASTDRKLQFKYMSFSTATSVAFATVLFLPFIVIQDLTSHITGKTFIDQTLLPSMLLTTLTQVTLSSLLSLFYANKRSRIPLQISAVYGTSSIILLALWPTPPSAVGACHIQSISTLAGISLAVYFIVAHKDKNP